MTNNPAKILIANWKMNGALVTSMRAIKELRMNFLQHPVSCEVVICPPFTLLRDMAEKVAGTAINLGGQDCHFEEEGAYTGEISARMLRDMTCDYVILGHSERRQYNNETNEIVSKKAKTAIDNKLTTIICVGETLDERNNNLTENALRKQILESVPQNASESNIIVAYEPVWAIGSGQTPRFDQIEQTHKYIREVIKNELPQFNDSPRVVYGGSTSAENSYALLGIDGVDGLLIGKASLEIKQFWKMIESAMQ